MIYDSLTVDSSRQDWEKNIPIQSALKHKGQTVESVKILLTWSS